MSDHSLRTLHDTELRLLAVLAGNVDCRAAVNAELERRTGLYRSALGNGVPAFSEGASLADSGAGAVLDAVLMREP
ncbi:MAG: hypothetical protein PVJ57_21665 [Phycisphaerae bacterium]|jgi:hypothetical protein